MNRVPMTVLGEQSLREELERLKKIDRPRITQAIAEAREHGDLKENAEYHAAREQQTRRSLMSLPFHRPARSSSVRR